MKSNLLKKHAKSFYWASFFLSSNTLDKCSSLYNFCRTLDDIVDDDNNLEVKKEIFSKFKKDFENKNLNNQIIKDMWSVIDNENISKQIIIDLFDGVETDLKEKVVINSKKDLLVYSYRVAGTVGLMMSKILKVKNKEALKGAIDLGIAMQLTNIARDIIEDSEIKRVYIPKTWYKLRCSHIKNMTKEKQEILKIATYKIIILSEKFYKSSLLGMGYLPLRSRFAILLASQIYREIGVKIIKKNYSNLYKRESISMFGKIICLIKPQ